MKQKTRRIIGALIPVAAGAIVGYIGYKIGFKDAIKLAENNIASMMDGIEDYYADKTYNFVKESFEVAGHTNSIFEFIPTSGLVWPEDEIKVDILHKAITFTREDGQEIGLF